MSNYLELKAELATLNLKIEVALRRRKPMRSGRFARKWVSGASSQRIFRTCEADAGMYRLRLGDTCQSKDPASGATWNGKAREPLRIVGKDGTAFSPTAADETITRHEQEIMTSRTRCRSWTLRRVVVALV